MNDPRRLLKRADLLGDAPPADAIGRHGLDQVRRRHESTVVEAGELPRLSDAETASLIGASFGGYRIESVLARGSMSVVFRGVHPMRDLEAAIKIISFREAFAGMILQFLKEAETLERLSHLNITPIIESGIRHELFYIVMPRFDGSSLDRILEQRTLIPEPTLVGIAAQVLSALDHAHARRVVHRDLKPANVLVDRKGRVRVIDFGLVLDLRLGEGADRVVGTPPYIAPELWNGASPDARSDLYAFGVMLFQAAAGRLPFEALRPKHFRRAHLEQPVPDPRRLEPAISPEFGRIIMRALEKDPGARFQSASDLLRALCAMTNS